MQNPKLTNDCESMHTCHYEHLFDHDYDSKDFPSLDGFLKREIEDFTFDEIKKGIFDKKFMLMMILHSEPDILEKYILLGIKHKQVEYMQLSEQNIRDLYTMRPHCSCSDCFGGCADVYFKYFNKQIRNENVYRYDKYPK